ncbi:UNVERIFIED_CONTAM: hypothetical protein Cloal_0228 [Acetivibrio alkalicellulosi]
MVLKKRSKLYNAISAIILVSSGFIASHFNYPIYIYALVIFVPITLFTCIWDWVTDKKQDKNNMG